MMDVDPADAEATAQRFRLEDETTQRLQRQHAEARRRERQRQHRAPPEAPAILEMVEHRERNAHRVLALQELADQLAGACLDVIEADRGIVRARIAERLHAVLLASSAWRGYVPPEHMPRGLKMG
jgi:hypothetical protein